MRPQYKHVALLLLLTAAAYANTLSVPFYFDDYPNIIEAPWSKGWQYFSPFQDDLGSVGQVFLRRITGYFTLALNYRLAGADTTSYHVVNIAIHMASTLASFWLVLLTMRTPLLINRADPSRAQWAAFIAAALFALHPVQTQAVTYIVQRFASMEGLFYISSLAFYLSSRLAGGHRAQFIASLVFALLAMTTKENAFTLPAVVALMELTFFFSTLKESLKRAAPFAAAALLCVVTVILFLGSAQSLVRLDTPIARDEYFYTQLRVLVTYLRLLVLPINQVLIYDYPTYKSLFALPVLASLVLHLALVSGAVVAWRRGGPWCAAGFWVAWFYVTISIEAGLIPIRDVIFEHRLYVPSLGAWGLVSVAYASINKHRRAVTVALLCVLAIFMIATIKRNAVWQSPYTLWGDVVAKSPNIAGAHYSLALAHQEQGRMDEALAHYARALALKPDYSDAANNIALIYQSMGQQPKAVEILKRAMEQDPRHPVLVLNLGSMYEDMGQRDAALAQYQHAAQMKPDFAQAHYNAGTVLYAMGREAEARDAFERALNIDDRDPDAHFYLALIARKAGDRALAREHLRRTLELNPGDSEARRVLDSL